MAFRTTILSVASALALASCGSGSPAPVTTPPPPVTATTPQPASIVSVTGGAEQTVKANDTRNLQVEVDNPADIALTFSVESDTPSAVQATIGETGMLSIQGIGVGSAVLTVTISDAFGRSTRMEVSVTVAPAAPEGIIFETDFSKDVGYAMGRGSIAREGSPAGFDGVRIGGDLGNISVHEGEGTDGSPALKVEYHGGARVRATVTLFKHLTGNQDTGYDELYLRYNMRFADDYAISRANTFWKWGRLWQNSTPTRESGNNWTENRIDSGYILWTMGSQFRGNTGMGVAFSENEGENVELGSVSGPWQSVSWRNPPEGVDRNDSGTWPGYWNWFADGALQTEVCGEDKRCFTKAQQDYITFEWRFKLATAPGADDGVFEAWVNGEKLPPWTTIRPVHGAPERDGIPLINKGSGMNLLSVFDNMQGFNQHFHTEGVDGHYWLSDVVVSTEPIGHDYVAGYSGIGTGD